MIRRAGGARRMLRDISRRRLLTFAAGFAVSALADRAHAQVAAQAKPKRAAVDEFSVTEPVSIQVNARPIPQFDPRDRARNRFGELEYRSGLSLTSSYRGFGGLSAIRVDPKGENFISLSDRG